MPSLVPRGRALASLAEKLLATGILTRACAGRFRARSSPENRPRGCSSPPAAFRARRLRSEQDGANPDVRRRLPSAGSGVRLARRDIPYALASGSDPVATRAADTFHDAQRDSVWRSRETAAAVHRSE